MIIFLFWLSIALLCFIYAGYPITIFFAAQLLNKTPYKKKGYPSVGIVIAAHNEEKVIKNTIENKLSLNYPREKFSLYVVSDASNDATDTFVEEYRSRGITLFKLDHRGGKTAALNYAISQINCDIIVFSDANSHFHKDALLHLVKNFFDPEVGYVTGKMVYTNPDGSLIGSGCTSYMRYENFLRFYETKCGSVVGVDGGIDAVRKTLYNEMPVDAQPDFYLPLKVIELGYRVIYEPEAILNEKTLSLPGEEYRMRLRVSLRAFHVLNMMKHLLNPLKYGFFSFQLIIHKLLRYLAGIFLLMAFLLNFYLADVHPVYSILLGLQFIFYTLALIGYFLKKQKGTSLTYIPFYFVVLNISSLVAFIQFLIGKKQIIWQPRKG
jgi:cellulose synthase/poly-beta-1,6-N-acetylglucosamine synthase-like glycosyltransferase